MLGLWLNGTNYMGLHPSNYILLFGTLSQAQVNLKDMAKCFSSETFCVGITACLAGY